MSRSRLSTIITRQVRALTRGESIKTFIRDWFLIFFCVEICEYLCDSIEVAVLLASRGIPSRVSFNGLCSAPLRPISCVWHQRWETNGKHFSGLFVYPFRAHFDCSHVGTHRFAVTCRLVRLSCVLSLCVQGMVSSAQENVTFSGQFPFGANQFGQCWRVECIVDVGETPSCSLMHYESQSTNALCEYKWCVQIELELSTETVIQPCGKTYHFASTILSS